MGEAAGAGRHDIGIFGGSFNPIHVGHIGLARHIMLTLGLDEVWFLVSPLNPFKKTACDLLDDATRLRIAQEALADHPRLVASDYEFRLPKPSYTWNTLAHLKADYPSHRFTLIIGADNWAAFDRWAKPEYILANCDIAVYARADSPVDATALPPNVHLVDAGLYQVSSTEIRRRVRDGEPIDGLVPRRVVEIVEDSYREA